ncbi:hypothetical protein [Staphylococcus aureus]|uniref:hypothetical protein n=1 Tax=Staphylococcus aureus TaxID=1280 RepID=UPI0022EA7CB7|nr:hypothetical protein [Staphylococcus aureus]
MNIMQFKSLLKSMYEETKQNDPIVANVYIEIGWVVNRLLDNNELSPFDDYDRVEEKIMNEINWKKTHIKEC